MYVKIIKRCIDFILALLGCIILSPVMLVISMAIVLDSKGPVFFKQKRIGIHKTHFQIYKFRTMNSNAPKNCPTHLLMDSYQYITKIGKFLRKTSLDELPQLWNILLGDMSFVGPRPALWNQYDLISLRDKYGANDLRPGLTGWAQINGRDILTNEKKAEYDGKYVERVTFGFDIQCIIGTVIDVFTQKGIREGGDT